MAMKRIILASMLLLICSIVNAQHLTYTSFMKVVKYESITDLNNIMGSYVYSYGGISYYFKGTQDERQLIYWVKNCRLVPESNEISWETGKDHSCLYISPRPGTSVELWYVYSFPNKSSYKAFIKTAKQNGFVFSKDGVNDDYLYSEYERRNNKKHYTEHMQFVEYANPQYEVIYWKN